MNIPYTLGTKRAKEQGSSYPGGDTALEYTYTKGTCLCPCLGQTQTPDGLIKLLELQECDWSPRLPSKGVDQGMSPHLRSSCCSHP